MKLLNALLKTTKIIWSRKKKVPSPLKKYIRDINTFAEWSDGREITKTLVLEY